MIESTFFGKRIAALDVGTKRIGYATSDEYHVAVTPRLFFDATKTNLFDIISEQLQRDDIGVLVVGLPLSHTDEITPMAKLIQTFCTGLRSVLTIPVIEYDEAFSTREAFQSMAVSKKSKKKRQEKGQKDMVAAAVILRNFLDDLRRNQ